MIRSQLSDEEMRKVDLERLLDLECNRQLIHFASSATSTLANTLSGRRKLVNGAALLGLDIPWMEEDLVIKKDPIIRFQWMVVLAAITPKRDGTSIRAASLNILFDAYASSERDGSRYSSEIWQAGKQTHMRYATCLSSATVCMRSFRKGLRNIMGTAVTQAYCFDMEVVLAYLQELELEWKKLKERKDSPTILQWKEERQKLACVGVFVTLYVTTACRPGELEQMTRENLMTWQEKLIFLNKRYVKVFVPDSKTDQSGGGDYLYIAARTSSGLRPRAWMLRLYYAGKSLNWEEEWPAIGFLGRTWSGAEMMNLTVIPGMKKLAEKVLQEGNPRNPLADSLRSVVWVSVQTRSLRRCAIHTLRLRGNRPEIVNFFGRWSAPDGSKMSGPLRQAVCSGKRSSFRNDVKKKTSKTKGFSVSQDKVRMDVTKGNGLAAEDSTKEIDGKVGRDAGKTKETVEVTIAGKTVPHRPMETDPLTGRAVHRLAYFKIMDDQEKLEDKLLNEQLIQREKILAKKRQQIHLMAELVKLTNAPTAKQERAAWEPGDNQEKKHSIMGDETTIRRETGRYPSYFFQNRKGNGGVAAGNKGKTNKFVNGGSG